MNKKLTEQDEKFLIENWLSMSNKKLADVLGLHWAYIPVKAKVLGLPDKRFEEVNYYRRKDEEKALEEIKNYDISEQTKLEFEGRKKTLEFEKIKNLIKEYNDVKIKVKADGPTAAYKIVNGTVIFRNKSLVVVKTEHYPESFKYVDFYTGRAVII